MSLRTPLGRARGLGSSKTGTGHWWMQRLTAVALVPLSLWFIVSLVGMTRADYATVIAWIQDPLIAMLLLLFIVSLFYHTLLGMQIVIEDYIDIAWQKIVCLVTLQLLTWFAATVAIFSVLKVALLD